MNEMTSKFDPDLREWIAERVESEAFENELGYLEALVRKDQREYAEWVREKLREGEASGYMSVEDSEQFFEDLKAGKYDHHARA